MSIKNPEDLISSPTKRTFSNKTLGILSLVLGVFPIILLFINYLFFQSVVHFRPVMTIVLFSTSIIASIAGFIFGIIAIVRIKKEEEKRIFAILGIVLCSIFFILEFVILILFILVVHSFRTVGY